MALKLDGDDPVMLGQGEDDRSEAEFDREQASVEENEWRSQSVLLKVEMNPVDIGVRHTGRDDTKNFNSSRPRSMIQDVLPPSRRAFSRSDRPKYGVREAGAVQTGAGEDRCGVGVGDVVGR